MVIVSHFLQDILTLSHSVLKKIATIKIEIEIFSSLLIFFTGFHWIILKSEAGLEEFLSSLLIFSGLLLTLIAWLVEGRLCRLRMEARRCLLEVVITRGPTPDRYWRRSEARSDLAG